MHWSPVSLSFSLDIFSIPYSHIPFIITAMNSIKLPTRKSFNITPVRKLFFRTLDFKSAFSKHHNNISKHVPNVTLGKRRRQDENTNNQDHADPIVPAESKNAVTTTRESTSPLHFALQNIDPTESDDDTIIITALSTIPFCCHEDLLTMTREQLISAALSLNVKLPMVLRIDVSHTRSDAFIRRSIEFVVGLSEVPPAPKAVRSRSRPLQAGMADTSVDMDTTPPSSPLVTKRTSRAPESSHHDSYSRPEPTMYISLGTPISRMARLQEEDSDDECSIEELGRTRDVDGPSQNKRRKVSGNDVDLEVMTPTPLPRTHILRSRPRNLNINTEFNSPTPKHRDFVRSKTQNINRARNTVHTRNNLDIENTQDAYKVNLKGAATKKYRYKPKPEATHSEIRGATKSKLVPKPSLLSTRRHSEPILTTTTKTTASGISSVTNAAPSGESVLYLAMKRLHKKDMETQYRAFRMSASPSPRHGTDSTGLNLKRKRNSSARLRDLEDQDEDENGDLAFGRMNINVGNAGDSLDVDMN